MTYESQGILTEGWTFDIEQETGSGETQPSKRPRKKSGAFVNCAECGGEYRLWHRSDKAIYCSPECNYAAKRRITDERAKCLACHALVGMTCTASGKMVGVGCNPISLERKKRGIKHGSYALASKVSHIKRMNHPDYVPPIASDTSAIEYTRACMKSIRQAGIGFDWSRLWYDHQSLKGYHALTKEQKIQRSRRQVNTLEKKVRKQNNHNAWKRAKRKSDPIFAIVESFRARLCKIAQSKDERTKELIGCSPLQLRTHLESKFTRRMTWANYGSYWHVDHILPCASFDHSIASQRKQCWHWTNLQPMEAQANFIKSDKILNPQMSLLLCATH